MSDTQETPQPQSSAAAPADLQWEEVAQRPEFKNLLSAKARFIIPMCVFFLAYYFALPILVGLAPDLMAKKVYGAVNVAYLFALSQFFMTWIVAIVYAKAAAKFDKRAQEVAEKLHV